MPKAAPQAPRLKPQTAAALRRRLLVWYTEHHRQLPWRPRPKSQTANPYHVLISEAMLQQTQVATVIPYFHRFLEAFPTIQDLANAPEQEVLRLWQGLGYYRRARHLHAAARAIVADHQGRVPNTVEALLALPGVGRYTAGAIASIAHHVPAPLVDGNVERVFARWFELDINPADPQFKTTCWSLAEQLVPKQHPGDFNQALMELGATVCTATKSPACDDCPIRGLCRAQKANRQHELPRKRTRKAPAIVHHHVCVIQRRDTYLVQQRPDTGLWSGMWEFITLENQTPATDQLQQTLGLRLNPLTPHTVFTHQTTHRKITFHLHHTADPKGRLKPGRARWQTLPQIRALPMSNPQRRVVDWLDARN